MKQSCRRAGAEQGGIVQEHIGQEVWVNSENIHGKLYDYTIAWIEIIDTT